MLNKPYIVKVLVFVALNCLSGFSFSQSLSDAFLRTTVQSLGTVSGTVVTQLSDTANVSEIEVLLGTEEGSSDLVAYSFIYDSGSGWPAGFSYSRTADKVTLSIGQYAESPLYFLRLRLKDGSGNYSQPFSLVAN